MSIEQSIAALTSAISDLARTIEGRKYDEKARIDTEVETDHPGTLAALRVAVRKGVR